MTLTWWQAAIAAYGLLLSGGIIGWTLCDLFAVLSDADDATERTLSRTTRANTPAEETE